MPSQTRQFGDIGEKNAEVYLVKKGYRIVDHNFRIKNLGEIDLVGERKGKITFFEVKTRQEKYALNFPTQTSINRKKRSNLKRICQLYLNEKKRTNVDWQVDAIFINYNDAGTYSLEHLENVLWEEYY